MRPQKGEMEELDREFAMLLYEQLRDRKDLTEVEEWRKQEPNRWLSALSMEMSCFVDVGHGAYRFCTVTREKAKDCDDSGCDLGMLCTYYRNPPDCDSPCLQVLMAESDCQRFLQA